MIPGIKKIGLLVRSAAGMVLSRVLFNVYPDELHQRLDVILEIDMLGILSGMTEPGQIKLLTGLHEYRIYMEKDGDSGGAMRSFNGNPIRFYSSDRFAFSLPFALVRTLSAEAMNGILILSSGFETAFSSRFASMFARHLVSVMDRTDSGDEEGILEEVWDGESGMNWKRLG